MQDESHPLFFYSPVKCIENKFLRIPENHHLENFNGAIFSLFLYQYLIDYTLFRFSDYRDSITTNKDKI